MTAADQVLSVAQMRAAEQALIDAGATAGGLMDRAGAGVAEWVWRVAAGRAVTVLCGPGNNGGDGYVAARELLRRGADVTVIAAAEPATTAAIAARQSYSGALAGEARGAVLVDCLFGSGLTRALTDEHAALLRALASHHGLHIAVDVPSGIDADTGRAVSEGLPDYHLTLALGAYKPAHGLMPAIDAMGDVRLITLGLTAVAGAARIMRRPGLDAPAADAHKYSRGLVLVVEGVMPGAARLACAGALHAGAGSVRLSSERLDAHSPPDVVVGAVPLAAILSDARIGAVVAGPGLGLGDSARARLRAVLAAGRACVIDADALRLLDRAALARVSVPLILTPHAGEMEALATNFALTTTGKVDQARELAAMTRAVVVSKGADTVIASPGGQVVFARAPTSWLSVGGSGDVLSGIAAARLAWSCDPFRAACEAVWLHGEAGWLSSPAFTASELAERVSAAYAACL
ncbi:MAG: NAD(P)H-hydrate dehydratase [Croceibacterium sp.]